MSKRMFASQQRVHTYLHIHFLIQSYSTIIFFRQILAGAKSLLANKITDIEIENLGCAQSSAEGAHLSVYKYQASKCPEKRSPQANLKLVDGSNGESEWKLGASTAESQNWARFLMDSPANLMTPTILAKNVEARFKVTLKIHSSPL